jgi:RHS repeat-associated protein
VNEAATVTVGGKPAAVDAANNFRGAATVPSGTSNVVVAATDASSNLRTNTYQVSQNSAPTTLTYDANGNLASDGARTFEWDAQDRLIAVNQGTSRSESTYDGYGRRVRIVEKTGGVTTSDRRFLWCSSDLCEERDSPGTTVTKRFFGQGVQDGGAAFYYTRDHLGSIRELTDNTGAIRARYDYDIYGRATKVSGDKDAPFGFGGYYTHAPSGLALTLYRAYDSSVGRWLSQDPLGFVAGVNFYAYAENNPVSLTDPFGLNPRDKYYGLPKEFWNWYHRQMKDPGEPDLTKPDAEDMKKEWERQGEPDADGHRTKPVPEPAPDPDPSTQKKPKDPNDPNDPDSKRVCTGPNCPEVLVPVVVGTGVGAYIIWKIVKTCGCTAAGGPLLGGVCLVTP